MDKKLNFVHQTGAIVEESHLPLRLRGCHKGNLFLLGKKKIRTGIVIALVAAPYFNASIIFVTSAPCFALETKSLVSCSAFLTVSLRFLFMFVMLVLISLFI